MDLSSMFYFKASLVTRHFKSMVKFKQVEDVTMFVKMKAIEEETENVDGYMFESDTENEVSKEAEKRGVKRKYTDGSSGKKSGKKLRKLRKENQFKKLHKAPTADELNRLRETENLFHSNLFRLQIEEMLKEIQVKPKHKKNFESWFEKFSDWVMKIEDNEAKYELNDQEWLKKFKIKIPVLQVPYFVKGTYQFRKPSSVSIIGSYIMNLLLGPKFVVDVYVEIPETFFQKEDYLNCRYHRKRALYMCELLHHIQLLPNLVEDVHFVSEEMDHLKPKIEIIPFGKFNKYVTVMLHLGLGRNTYKLNRFSPSKNNVRKNWYFKKSGKEQGIKSTPFYNSSIVGDLTIQENMTFLKKCLLMHDNIKDGIILLKIWLHQRELGNSISGFNGYCVAMLVCYLLQIRKLNLLMSSYQVFRNVCHYLSECDWTTNGITLCNTTGDDNLPSMLEFHENYNVVFVDVSGYHNITFAMSPSLFQRVQHEAKLALNWLNNPIVNSFQVLFITKVPFYQHYDHMVIFNNGELLENIADVHCSKDTQLSHCSVISPLVRESVINLLRQGLGERVSQLHVKLPTKNRWKVGKKPRKSLTLTIGFNLNPNNYFSVVDKALESETESFRQFWGERSELRRFQDGSITEAVVWSGRTLSEKRLICKEILTYLLKSKFGLENNDFHYNPNQLDSYIAKDVEECSYMVSEAFDQLMKQLRSLNDLPLDIIAVQGTSPVFRYTDAFPPLPQKKREASQIKGKLRSFALINMAWDTSPPWISPVDVIIQMAGSSKWPQDVEAIRRVRAAFNIKISESLTSEHGLKCKAFQDKIEVLKNGFVFRIHLVYPNEIVLLKQSIDTDGLIKYKDTEKSLALEKESIYLPKLSSALHGLYQENNSFGPACCIVKRWISSHLIDEYHMSQESIELLVASLYLRPQPHEPPRQPQVAFLRFLQMMVTTNWITDCIILNINDELTRSEIVEIESDFNTNRQNLPSIFIATPYDRSKSIWTKDSPTPLILLRLTDLCATALHIIEEQIYSKILSESNVLFKPCLDSYDVVITLNDSYNPKKKMVTQKIFNFFKEDIQKIPINGFDPVSMYLQELRESYGHFALFFHDSYGGSVIAIVWKPNVLEPCDLKVFSLSAHKFNSKTKKLELHVDAILEDFWTIGKGLVKQIDVRRNGILQEFMLFTK